MRIFTKPAKGRLLVFLCGLLLPSACFSQACRDDLTAESQFWVHAISFNIRYLNAPDIPLKVNSLYSPAARSASQAALVEQLSKDDNQTGSLQVARFGYVAARIRAINSCVRVVEPAKCRADMGKDRCVDVTFSNYEIRIMNFNNGSLILPVPRSPVHTYFSGVPGPLLALNPTFTVGHDDRTGTTPAANMNTDILNFKGMLHHLSSSHTWQIPAQVNLSRSVEHGFYQANEVVSIERNRNAGGVRKFGLRLEQLNANQPLGLSSDSESQETGGLRLDTHLENPFPRDIHLWMGGSATRHTVPGTAGEVKTSEGAGAASAVLDGRIRDATTRAGVWFTGASPNNTGTYQSLEAFTGLQKEILVATNQSFGVQLIGGYGHLWGTPPNYAQFFAGNSSSNFLYQSPESLLLQPPPSAIIRSFGKNEVGLGTPNSLTGATSFWNVSATVSIPIPGLSRPLIPDEVIEEETHVTLKQVIKKAGPDSAVSFLQTTLVNQGLSREEAHAKATAIVNREIRPAVNYITDHANIYSLKPLVLFDIAQASGRGLPSRHMESLGGGLEFMIVNFAFEAGYAATLNRQPSEPAGNVFISLQFRNFF